MLPHHQSQVQAKNIFIRKLAQLTETNPNLIRSRKGLHKSVTAQTLGWRLIRAGISTAELSCQSYPTSTTASSSRDKSACYSSRCTIHVASECYSHTSLSEFQSPSRHHTRPRAQTSSTVSYPQSLTSLSIYK